MESSRYYIGLDDTDAGDSVGTGALARELATHLARELGARHLGITRHQLLVHPDIPYTSHNSAACIEIDCPAPADRLAHICREFLRFLYHPGADPGLCLVRPQQIVGACAEFGRRAQQQVVDMDEARGLAERFGILLEEHGGTGLGVIGALAACGLRAGGDDGRFIAHRGIRGARDEMTAAEIVEQTAVQAVVDDAGKQLDPAAVVRTRNWIRPDLRAGRAVLQVRPAGSPGRYEVARKKPGADDV